MRKLTLRFSAFALAFLFGFGVFTFLKVETAPQANLSLDDQWHRLYEAAGMSGDDETFQKVIKSLMCADMYGVPAGRLVEHNEMNFCVRSDHSRHEFRPGFNGVYGEYFNRISKTHVKWSVENLEFVRTVSSKKKALSYFKQHSSFIE